MIDKPVEMEPHRQGRPPRRQLEEKLDLLATELALVKGDLFGLARCMASNQMVMRAMCSQLQALLHPLNVNLISLKDTAEADEALLARYLRDTTEGGKT